MPASIPNTHRIFFLTSWPLCAGITGHFHRNTHQLKAKAHMEIASVYRDMKEPNTAKLYYQKAMHTPNISSKVQSEICLELAEMGNSNSSKYQLYRKAISLNPALKRNTKLMNELKRLMNTHTHCIMTVKSPAKREEYRRRMLERKKQLKKNKPQSGR